METDTHAAGAHGLETVGVALRQHVVAHLLKRDRVRHVPKRPLKVVLVPGEVPILLQHDDRDALADPGFRAVALLFEY